MTPWPHPRIVAHRGGGALAPENTLGAIRLGASLGFRGVEFDVMLAGDGTPVLIHDETLERTTGARGKVCETGYAELARLDAGNGERIPRFEDAIALCNALGLWANIEIKPAQGFEAQTGAAVGAMTQELWKGKLPPVLSSFALESLEEAKRAAPPLPRGLLVDALPPDWEEMAKRFGCASVHCNFKKISPDMVREVHSAGLALLLWTVNEPEDARRLLGWGADGLFTDALDRIGPGFAA